MPLCTQMSYVICTSPRSGSTMLCKLLSATGTAGNPASHFHEPSIDAWFGYYDLNKHSFASEQAALNAIFAAAFRVGQGGTGIFGLRLQRDSFQFFADQIKLLHPCKATDRERMEAVFGNTQFIYLKRESHLDQAISRLRAEQTGLWHRNADGTDLERKEPTYEAGYDYGKIQAFAQQAVEQNEEWVQWFAKQSIAPITITYEELSRRPQAVLSVILTSLGLDASIAENVPLKTAKLADETNLAWRTRFVAETKAGL